MIDIFIPSYHRANNLKTVNYFLKIGWDAKNIHVVIDNEADDFQDYKTVCNLNHINLHVFDIEMSRKRYDYVHLPSAARRSAGQARNMFYDIAKDLNIDFFVMQDDDTTGYEIKKFGKYVRMANFNDIFNVFEGIKEFMVKRHIGLFGISQTGDVIGGENKKILRRKVMNTSFINTKYIYRGERGVQDDDTSQFASIMNEGLFTGSMGDGLFLKQTPSAKSKGGLTDLYNECKLLNKSLITPIQFPSAIYAEKQKMNGGRLHHHIKNKYLMPRLLKGVGNDNIKWDAYEDDIFTNEPKR